MDTGNYGGKTPKLNVVDLWKYAPPKPQENRLVIPNHQGNPCMNYLLQMFFTKRIKVDSYNNNHPILDKFIRK